MFDAIQFSSFSEFLAMGGYAFNVWSVYFLFLVSLLANTLLPLYRKKQIFRELGRRRSRDEDLADRSQVADDQLHNEGRL